MLPSQCVELARSFLSWRRSSYFLTLANSWFARQRPEVRYYGASGASLLAKRIASVNLLRPTRMCVVMKKCGSDKGSLRSWHNYTCVYSVLFRKYRSQPGRIFEIGLGSNNFGCREGASLRAWRELFPRVLVYGADIDRALLFQEERIKTFYCDQLDQAAILQLWSQPDLQRPLDVIIDDGLHTFEGNISFLDSSIDHLSPGGLYIVEDIEQEAVARWHDRIETIYSKRYPTYEFVFVVLPHAVNHHDNNLLVIRACRG